MDTERAIYDNQTLLRYKIPLPTMAPLGLSCESCRMAPYSSVAIYSTVGDGHWRFCQ